MHMLDQLCHETHVTTLVSVQRGWMEMPSSESTKQFFFKWYLEEYAASVTDRTTPVQLSNWGKGVCEILSIAANFLKRKIYVLGHTMADLLH